MTMWICYIHMYILCPCMFYSCVYVKSICICYVHVHVYMSYPGAYVMFMYICHIPVHMLCPCIYATSMYIWYIPVYRLPLL